MRVRKRWLVPLAALAALAGLVAGVIWYVHTPAQRAQRLVNELAGRPPSLPERWLEKLGLVEPRGARSPEEVLAELAALGESAVGPVRSLLAEGTVEQRTSAIGALRRLGPAGIDGLIDALSDEDRWVAEAAAAALASMDDTIRAAGRTGDVVVGLVRSSREPPRYDGVLTYPRFSPTREALWRIGPAQRSDLPALTALLRHERPAVRKAAARALGDMGDDGAGAAGALTEALGDRAYSVVREAARSLVRIGPAIRRASPAAAAAAVERLIPLVTRSYWSAGPAVQALLKIAPDDPRVTEALLAALRRPDLRACEDLTWALGCLAPRLRRKAEAVDALLSVLERPFARATWPASAEGAELTLSVLEPPFARATAATFWALGRIEPPDARRAARVRAAVAALLSGDMPGRPPLSGESRRAAAGALGRIGRADRKTIALLVSTLKDPSDRVASAAARALGRLGAGDTPEQVAAALRAAAKRGAQAVSPPPEQGDREDLRRAASVALGRIAPAAADETVIDGLIAAVRSEPLDELRPHIPEYLARDGVAWTLALSEITREQEQEDTAARRSAAEALGAIGPRARRAAGALRGALKDPDAALRAAAGKALERTEGAASQAAGNRREAPGTRQ